MLRASVAPRLATSKLRKCILTQHCSINHPQGSRRSEQICDRHWDMSALFGAIADASFLQNCDWRVDLQLLIKFYSNYGKWYMIQYVHNYSRISWRHPPPLTIVLIR